MEKNEFFKKVKELFSSVEEESTSQEEESTSQEEEKTEQKFLDVKTSEGDILRVPHKDSMEVGDVVVSVTEDGSVEIPNDGEKEIDDGRKVIVESGLVKDLREAEGGEGESEDEGQESPSAPAESEQELSENSELENRISQIESTLKELNDKFSKIDTSKLDEVEEVKQKVEELSKQPASSQKTEKKNFGRQVVDEKKEKGENLKSQFHQRLAQVKSKK